MTTNNETTARDIETINQRICEQLVHREVLHCVSSLVSHFAQNSESLNGSDYSQDDLFPILQSDDYENAVRENSDSQIFEDSNGTEFWLNRNDFAEFETITDDDERNEYLSDNAVEIEDADTWRTIADDNHIEPYTNEAYEHWAVKSWLAGKLAEHGEMTGELFDFNIWGRCTTGQSIAMDGVIRQIAASMEILHGMQNDWSK
jgi:hypothetical protein